MASRRRASMAADAPVDVLMSILVRLPVITLLRCRCVCKTWCALISSPLFVSAHYDYHSAAGDRRALILRRYDPVTAKMRYTLHSDDDSLREMAEFGFPLPNPNEFSRILGYVNGLICMLAMSDNCKLMLWNPAIRKYKILPNLSRDFTGQNRSVFGFGFDPIADDYKVVRVVYGSCRPRVEIYRLSTRSWSRTGLVGEVSALPVLFPRQAYLNGTVQWLGHDSTIVRFDLRTETFRLINLPGDLKGKRMGDVAIASWCGLLALFQLECPTSISLWVMKECDEVFSWTRQCVIPSHAFARRCKSIRTDGKILVEDIFGSLFWFDPKTLEIKDQTVRGLGDLNVFYMRSYLESLVLIDPWRPQRDVPSERAMATGLSEGVLVNILMRLPANSLICCRLVCKSWCSLISSPRFISAHHKHDTTVGSRNMVVLHRCDHVTEKVRYTLHCADESLTEMTEFDFSFQHPYGPLRIIGSVNGLICMLSKVSTLILWNPTIRKFLILPDPSFGYAGPNFPLFGFGFDPLANDYKVVRIFNGAPGPSVEIYRLNTRRWSRIGLNRDAPATLPFPLDCQACVNGVIHWLGYGSTIVGFDLPNETIRVMGLPGDLKGKRIKDVEISDWHGLLALLIEEPAGISLWVMKEYNVVESWTRQCVVILCPDVFPKGVKGIVTNGEILVESTRGSLFWLNPITLQVRRLTVEANGDLAAFSMISCSKSLALLNVKDARWMPDDAQMELHGRRSDKGVGEGSSKRASVSESRPRTSLPNVDAIEALKRKWKEKIIESML